MTETIVRPRRPEDDAQSVSIANQVFSEFPPESVEETRHWIKNTPPTAYRSDLVAERDGTVVGSGNLYEMFWAAERNRYSMNMVVAPTLWGQGIGSALYNAFLADVQRRGGTRLYTWIKSNVPEAASFAEHRGFAPSGHEHRMSRLDVHVANLDGYDGLEDRLRAEDIRVTTVAALDPDETQLHAIHALDNDTTKDVPQSEEFVSTPFETWYRDAFQAPGASTESFWLALHGDRPVGMAVLRRQGPNAAWNSFTGVTADFRGKGVARALKKRTIDWARANGVDYIFTGNDVSNERMLAVNVRLGYQPLPPITEMVKDL
ncbi:MAG TPA: GNAT family N-acetyltransferase [Chloroflexota bacterium]